jgi:hypothetical protein
MRRYIHDRWVSYGIKFERPFEREDVVIGIHAAIQVRERRISVWQVVNASPAGELLVERPSAKPNPAIELEIVLADGTAAKAVWAWLRHNSKAKLVTVHFFDR